MKVKNKSEFNGFDSTSSHRTTKSSKEKFQQVLANKNNKRDSDKKITLRIHSEPDITAQPLSESTNKNDWKESNDSTAESIERQGENEIITNRNEGIHEQSPVSCNDLEKSASSVHAADENTDMESGTHSDATQEFSPNKTRESFDPNDTRFSFALDDSADTLENTTASKISP